MKRKKNDPTKSANLINSQDTAPRWNRRKNDSNKVEVFAQIHLVSEGQAGTFSSPRYGDTFRMGVAIKKQLMST